MDHEIMRVLFINTTSDCATLEEDRRLDNQAIRSAMKSIRKEVIARIRSGQRLGGLGPITGYSDDDKIASLWEEVAKRHIKPSRLFVTAVCGDAATESEKSHLRECAKCRRVFDGYGYCEKQSQRDEPNG
jgi:ribosomal protein S20